MEVDVLNMEGQKVSTVELPARIFEAPINVDLMHQAYVRQMANARLGTHIKPNPQRSLWWWSQTLAPERHRSRSPGFHSVSAHMGGWWQGAHP
jgi:hypothetical protein